MKLLGRYNVLKLFLFSVPLITAVLFSVSLNGNVTGAIVLLMIPVSIFCVANFDRFHVHFFVMSLFVGFTFFGWYRLQLVNLVVVVLLAYMLSNIDTEQFNRLKLPTLVKLAGSLLIISIFISAINSPYVSKLSIYYATEFLMCMASSYLFFRYVKHQQDISSLIDSFVLLCVISSIIIFVEILLTGRTRSLGLASYPIMDFSACALLICVFRYIILGHPGGKKLLYTMIILLVLVTTQSRFAWLGFILSFLYGLFICFHYRQKISQALFGKFFSLALVASIAVIVLVGIGLEQVITSRASDISLNLFAQREGSDIVISNSLESRVLIWLVAWNTFLHNPLTGVGYQMFNIVSVNYNTLPSSFFEAFVRGADAHTTYLNFLAETGLLGFLSFLGYVILIFSLSTKSIRYAKSQDEITFAIILNILVFFIMVHSIYSGAFTIVQNAFYMHFIFGISTANFVILKRTYLR